MRAPTTPAARGRTRAKGRSAEREPRDLLRRDTRNTRLHVPRVDWTEIRVGQKREFRNYGSRIFNGLEFPTPAIGYCAKPWWTPADRTDNIDTCLLTVEESWVEPLGAISPASLEREGFATISDFRRYFAERYPAGGFRPLAKVVVYVVHPTTAEEAEEFGRDLWRKMYGQFG